MTNSRFMTVVLAAFVCLHVVEFDKTAVAADPSAVLDAPTAAFLQQHCIRCHSEKKAEADLRLDKLGADPNDAAVFDRWHSVVARLRAGDMPPEGEPRPPTADVATIIRRMSARLDEALAARKSEGRVVLRRLNRTEYENTVRDLFAVNVDVKEMLPEDTISLGFDNVGAALNVSPVLVERYLEAADAVISAAIAPVTKVKPVRETHLLMDSMPTWFKTVYPINDNELVLFRGDSTPTFLGKVRAREAGRYRFRIPVRAYQSDEPLTLAVLAGNFNSAAGSARHVGYFDVHPGKLRDIVVEVPLRQRETIKLYPVAMPRIYLRKENFAEYPGPGVSIGPIELEGPLRETWPTESYRRIYGDVDPEQGTAADAERLLKQLLPRAFRRPTTDDDARPYVALTAKALEAGKPFDEALRVGIKAILCSPKFLYFREPAGPLDDYALASRLSYFFWNSLPDDELFDLAARGELHQPEVLRKQTERMLTDPKGVRFTENFTGQWLSLRDIEFTTPDPQLYPEFEEYLQWSMVQETQTFFNELLKNDLSVQNFIDSDFAMLNNRMAKHYGIDGVEGMEFRRVALKPEMHRGGVLTHASVLKVTANGTTTSPVVRGVWVMDHIIGRPAKPPPPNVPAIEPDIRGAVTIREQLAKHRKIESCAACHKQIDPPGFALENYDVIGGFRERYRALGTKERAQLPPVVYAKYAAKPGYGWGRDVEAGDKLPDGREFKDTAEFKRLLLADPKGIARCVTEKLMVYATGGGLQYGDHDEIERIVDEAAAKNYGLRTIVHLVIGSEMFRNK